MIPVLHGISNCDTVRKARAWLSQAGIDHRFHDHGKDGVDEGVLRRAIAAAGWEGVLNRRGTTFRGLTEVDRAELDDVRAFTLMLAHPATIRRPILETGDCVIVGFSEGGYADAFGRS